MNRMNRLTSETYYKTNKALILVKRKQVADTKRFKRALMVEIRLWHKLNRKQTLPTANKIDYGRYEKQYTVDLENGIYIEYKPITIYF